ncbi:hypothetical protein FQN60_006728, partial [Etheostoma spectabile]
MMNFYLPSGVARADGPVAGLTGVTGDNTAERVRQEDSTQAKKSSSTGDIREEEAEGLRRRLSLPGLLSQGRYAVHLLSSSYTLLRKAPDGSLLGDIEMLSPRLLRKAGRTRMRAVALTPLGGAVPGTQELFPTLQTEVWSWGQGEHGQLGHGDSLARLQPLCIKSLNNKEVVRVFSWGSNSSGQLGHMESPTTVPRLAKLSEGIRVWDISAGDRHTLLLADGDCILPIIYYSGLQVKEGADESHAKGAGQQEEGKEEEERVGGYTQQPVLLPFCMDRCVALSDRNVMGFIASLHELASAERKFYCKLCTIKTQIIRPLLEL